MGAETPTSRSPWRIGTVAGVEVRIHPTFLVVVGLAALGAFGSPLRGAIWLVTVFGSVVAHELAHSVVARRRGLPVLGIVLLPIGGVSEIERLPDRPTDELVVAAAGPLTSIAIGAVSLGVAAALGERLVPPDLVAGSFVHRFAWLNLFLAAFNLLPAFPLDGGRIARAAMAGRVGLDRATVIAAALGRGAAAAMALVAIIWDPWLLLIAAFVYLGSRTEEAATLRHVRLLGRRVRDVMVTTDDTPILHELAPVEVEDGAALEDAVDLLARSRASVGTVKDAAGRVVGVLRLEDVAPLVAERPNERRRQP